MDEKVIILNRSTEDWNKAFKGFLGSGGGGLRAWIALILLLLIIYVAKPFFTVGPAERGVVIRFGEHVRTKGPGLALKFPWPVESVIKLNVQEVRRLTIGYRESQDNLFRGADPSRKVAVLEEALMLTGDENILQVELSVQYQISDPAAYLFNVREPDEALRDLCEATLRRVVGDYGVDAPLTKGKATIALEIEEESQKLVDRYGLGLLLTAVQLEDVQPPGAVQASFKAVTTAKENKQKYINQAQGYRNGKIPEAEGRAAAVLNDASAYAQERVLHAKGEVLRFSAILAEYRSAPEVTLERLYLEAMEDILGQVNVTVVDPSLGRIYPLMDLGQPNHAPPPGLQPGGITGSEVAQ